MTCVGFLGLGDMGLPMARRLLGAGFDVIVWNRNRAKVDMLVADGAEAAGNPAEVMARAELIGLCLTSDKVVAEMAFQSDGLLSVPRADRRRLIADFSTGAPAAARQLASAAGQLNIGWVDAPVSGGVRGATDGSLVIFAGGEPADVDGLAPLFAPLSARVTHMGASGAGQAAKLCNQMIVSANLMAIAETIAVARAAGVDVDRLPEAFRGGFADSAPLQIFGPRMAARTFEPRLGAIALMDKDVQLAHHMASAAGVGTPVLDAISALYASAMGGPDIHGSDDLTRLIDLFGAI
ncbi:MAG: NAD(P)-dependent oxidoreductase [Sphingomonas sp.]|jgi:3-hydroxyisobutyrate dehydrogenase-like beta-hydroxyacid dehydrogenase|uniref:NAD(P)-dependent oxidoreductase n=1 Tax=Sphingomonas sp. TaxID=28214 RepID=UPI00356796E0